MNPTPSSKSPAGSHTTGDVKPKASIVINNFNYGRYVGEAIESALAQTYSNVEVIVVDDGSTDDSREIIRRYQNRVATVFKNNGGQGSALNTGFANSSGEVILFLDADDVLVASALEHVMPWFSDPAIVKVHWPLLEIDAAGRSLGKLMPGQSIPDGDLRARLCCDGPSTIAWPATSGNAWSRPLLERILPMPEDLYRTGADSYLFELAPFFGALKTIVEPLSLYRMHPKNFSRSMTFENRLARELRFADHYSILVAEQCKRLGHDTKPELWRKNSWWYRLSEAADEIRSYIPDSQPFILVDDAAWAMDQVEKRKALPLNEVDGVYAGPPVNDAAALDALERYRTRGVRFLVVAWQSNWWFDHYPGFAEHLSRAWRNLFSCNDVRIYEALS